MQVPLQSQPTFRGLHTSSSARVQDYSSCGVTYRDYDRSVRSQTTTYRPSQTVLNANTTIRSVQSFSVLALSRGGVGRFTTYVPAVDADRSRPRRVSGEDIDDPSETPDPYAGIAAPVGDTPWLLLLILLIPYALLRRRLSSNL